MSTTYDLICDECKEKYWAGQGYTLQGHYLYETDELANFLYTHQRHKLRYLSDHDMSSDLEPELMEYKNFEY